MLQTSNVAKEEDSPPSLATSGRAYLLSWHASLGAMCNHCLHSFTVHLRENTSLHSGRQQLDLP